MGAWVEKKFLRGLNFFCVGPNFFCLGPNFCMGRIFLRVSKVLRGLFFLRGSKFFALVEIFAWVNFLTGTKRIMRNNLLGILQSDLIALICRRFFAVSNLIATDWQKTDIKNNVKLTTLKKALTVH